jgi:hypothetical protein
LWVSLVSSAAITPLCCFSTACLLLLLFISLSTQSGNFLLHSHILLDQIFRWRTEENHEIFGPRLSENEAEVSDHSTATCWRRVYPCTCWKSNPGSPAQFLYFPQVIVASVWVFHDRKRKASSPPYLCGILAKDRIIHMQLLSASLLTQDIIPVSLVIHDHCLQRNEAADRFNEKLKPHL